MGYEETARLAFRNEHKVTSFNKFLPIALIWEKKKLNIILDYGNLTANSWLSQIINHRSYATLKEWYKKVGSSALEFSYFPFSPLLKLLFPDDYRVEQGINFYPISCLPRYVGHPCPIYIMGQDDLN